MLILNAPEGYMDALGAVPEGVEIHHKPEGKYDFGHLFVKDRAELERFIDPLLAAMEYDGILWISYPKGGSGVETDLNRDKLWAAMSDTGLRPVTQIAIDAVWSALRFRPAERVGR